jgi:hypothetical protein
VWTSLQAKPNALLTAPGGVPAYHAANAANGATPSVGKEGVSIDSIPVAEMEAHAARPGGPRRTKVTLEEDLPPATAAPVAVTPAPARTSMPEKIQLDEAQPAAPTKSATTKAAPPSEPTPAPAEEQPAPAPKTPPPETERGPFSKGAALSALASASGRATACSNPDGPSGSGRAMVTFSPDGPVTSISLPAPFEGTSVGQCVTNAFKSARVPAFTGSAVTLPGSFRVP